MIGQMEHNLRKKLMDNYPVSEKVIPLSLESFLPFLEFIREHRDFYRGSLKVRKEAQILHNTIPSIWKKELRKT